MKAERLHPTSNRVKVIAENDWEREFLHTIFRDSCLRKSGNWISINACYSGGRPGVDSVDFGVLTAPKWPRFLVRLFGGGF